MYVLFLDLLGFASSVMDLSEKDEAFFLESIQISQKDNFNHDFNTTLFSKKVETLFTKYVKFQKIVGNNIKRLEDEIAKKCSHERYSLWRIQDMDEYFEQSYKINKKYDIKSVLFSDSVFIACTDLYELIVTTNRIICDLYAFGPIAYRGGIAKGSFSAFQWSMNAGGGNRTSLIAPFLGSGVVRAYFSESKGCDGLRITINNNVVDDIISLDLINPIISLPKDEITDFGQYELNLLYQPWHDILIIDFCEAYKKAITQLMEESPNKVKLKYEKTLQALDRMNGLRK